MCQEGRRQLGRLRKEDYTLLIGSGGLQKSHTDAVNIKRKHNTHREVI